MLDFIKEVYKPSEDFTLRWLVAEYQRYPEMPTYRVVWLITQEWEVWDAHPKMIKSLLELDAMLHPKKISWRTIEPGYDNL